MPATASTDHNPLPLRVLLLHARADRHHAFALQQALAMQPCAPHLRVVSMNRHTSGLGIERAMIELALAKVDAVVFLLSPRYFVEHPDWAQQLALAQRSARALHVIVAEPLDLRGTAFQARALALPSNALPGFSWPRMLRLAAELGEQLVPPQPIRDVLCMFASPDGLDRLALDREWRAIDEVNRRGGKPLELDVRWAARVHDVQDVLLERRHELLHFSAHGEPGSLYFEAPDGQPEAVDTLALVHMLAKHEPRALIFNACHTAETLAEARQFVPHIIAMQGPTPDASAVEFSRAFYAALARGRTVDAAFEHAFDSLSLSRVHEDCRPRLL